MATLDSSVVNIALPTLTKELDADLFRIKWVVIVYLLMITCLVLPFGKLSDQKGRKLVFQLGYLIFTVGSALCSISPTLGWLILFRAFQAIGASMLMANGPAIITNTFSSRERGAALGTLAMVVSAGLVAGPSFGGFAIAHLGWRSIFWLNIPFGMIGVLLVQYFVKKDSSIRTPQTFDWAGSVVQTVLLLLLIVIFDPPFISISGSQLISISRWLISFFVVIFLILFIKVESSVQSPLLDFSLLKNRTFWTSNLAGFLTFVAFSSVSVLLPFFFENTLQFSTKRTGLFMTAIPLTIFAVAPISGRLSDRFGSQELSFFGALMGAFGLFYMSGLFGPGISAESQPVEIVLSLCTIGFAIGLFQSPNNSAIMGAVPTAKLGVASALLATVRNLGLVMGTGLATSILAWRLEVTGSFVLALHYALFVAGCVATAAVIASLGKRKRENYVGDQKLK